MGRIVRPVDFQRVLGTPPWARSAHFAVHHLPEEPRRVGPVRRLSTELSTDGKQSSPQGVEESAAPTPAAGWWLGLVVPKRHARRSVTRSLLKRQIRAAVGHTMQPAPQLRPGLWVVRLRAPIDRKQYPSASSPALREAMHAELGRVIGQAVQRCHG